MPERISKTQAQLLEITHHFLLELKAERGARAVSLESALENDLGLGSLERAELFHRIENSFAIELPSSVLAQISTLADLVPLITQAKPTQGKYQDQFVPQLTQSAIDPSTVNTLTEILAKYAEIEPDRPHIYLQGEDGHEQMLSYGELFKGASRVAAGLKAKRLRAGETVAIMLPTSNEFFFAFFGILLVGAIPVPIYPSSRPDRAEEYVRRQAKILQNAEIRLLVSFPQVSFLSQILKSLIPSLYAIVTVQDFLENEGSDFTVMREGSEPALIQYTSGSTGDPKGVLLTHNALLANIRAVGQALQIKPTDVLVSWLPLYHDMGLIGAWLNSLYHGVPLTLLSPLTFLAKPERWLWAIHYHRGTLSAAPNFAYELCVNKIKDTAIEGLDLSSWRLALNGAEAVHASTLRKFTQKFKTNHFNPKAMFPVYGLAESSVGLVFPILNQLPKIDLVDRDIFMQQNKAVSAKPDDPLALEMVCCGQSLPGHEVRIVDENNALLPERDVGALQFKGPSSMRGYYHNARATEAIYHQGWWDSGDLAYQVDGNIYIAGRQKDIIITAGRTVYPEEVEAIATDIPGVRKGCVIAFGLPDPERGTEQCVVVAETHAKDRKTKQNLMHSITQKVSTELGIMPHQVILLAPRTIPKTSSGKLQRSACKQAYLDNQLERQKRPVWVQLGHVFLKSQVREISNVFSQLGKFLYTLYVGFVLVLTLPILCLMVIPCSYKKSFHLVRGWAKWVLRFIFCRLRIKGSLDVLKTSPLIIVSNHASYVDAIVLLASLPVDIAFVAKKELSKVPILRLFIKKLRFFLVDRMDFSRVLQESSGIREMLQQGRSVLIFPEGTFTYATGLRAFKIGAFKLSVDTQTPVCTIGLKGTRQMLRGDNKLLTPASLAVDVGPLLIPNNSSWDEAVRLRDLAREDISKRSGEQTIDLMASGLAGR